MEPGPDRKAAAKSAGSDEGKYEQTEHGRRRVTKVPKPLSRVCPLITWPYRYVAARLRQK
jgi:hypothetical protein